MTMESSEVRQKFIDYFVRNFHTYVKSSSLIPENDASLLFANAGMNQFKNTFLGLESRPYVKAVSSQKCVRAGGKHNDLENVGFTARHHTFFEMLGNFSFGDYFKKEAIHFAWEFLTKELALPKDKLYVTVFETDDEAADIWHRQENVPLDRIFKFGEKDNFWRMGDTGPCGPCSEIFYDHGADAGTESDPYKGIASGQDRFVEIWNLVFMQYFEKAPGEMTPLPKPSVDTGAGLERLVAALQGEANNYNTDLFIPMIQKACQALRWNLNDLLKTEKDSQKRKTQALSKSQSQTQSQGQAPEFTEQQKQSLSQLSALRVLADHTRSACFLIADGAMPANEGRGYVLRRILRRALRYGRKLSQDISFMSLMAETLIEQMQKVYPELNQKKALILSVLQEEESRFLQTLDQGTQILNEELNELRLRKQKILSGSFAFKLYDTFGFPFDLTRIMVLEEGFSINEDEFEKEMNFAKEKSKSSWKGQGLNTNTGHLVELTQKLSQSENQSHTKGQAPHHQSQAVSKSQKETQFVGYDYLTCEGILLELTNGDFSVPKLEEGQTGFLISDKTSFYAEGGGQVGDQGIIECKTGSADVLNVKKINNFYFHQLEVKKGFLAKGAQLILTVESSKRRNTASNHSATHLLHGALRKQLGKHVAQAGSLVDDIKLRFDFNHPKPLSFEELLKIEEMVNQEIAKAEVVKSQIMKQNEAMALGALALFGEKYGDQVRVVGMGDFSTELCGGTHVSNTSQIRFFKIVSESGVSAGVRRIEAITGEVAITYALKNINENQKSRNQIGILESWQQYLDSKQETSEWIESKKTEIKNFQKDIKSLKEGRINIDELLEKATLIKSQDEKRSFRVVFSQISIDDRVVLSRIADDIKNKIQRGLVVVIGEENQTSYPICVSVTKDLLPSLNAGQILKEIASLMGGKGGGRSDFAQGTVPSLKALNEAQLQVHKIATAAPQP